MDDELFSTLYEHLMDLSPPRAKRVQFSDGLIAAYFLWSVIRNKPRSWACQWINAPKHLRDRPPPSNTTLSRRLRTDAVRLLLEQLEERLSCVVQTGCLMCYLIDGKGFPVNRFSKDKQAARGHSSVGMARGYKLHLIVDQDGWPSSWRVAPMNVAESRVALDLVASLEGQGYVVGDSAYDSNPLHRCVQEKGYQMVAQRKRPQTGLGARQHEPGRIRSVEMLEVSKTGFGAMLCKTRTVVERAFAAIASSKVGLDSLPGWVRTLDRVNQWVQGKMILWLAQKQRT